MEIGSSAAASDKIFWREENKESSSQDELNRVVVNCVTALFKAGCYTRPHENFFITEVINGVLADMTTFKKSGTRVKEEDILKACLHLAESCQEVDVNTIEAYAWFSGYTIVWLNKDARSIQKINPYYLWVKGPQPTLQKPQSEPTEEMKRVAQIVACALSPSHSAPSIENYRKLFITRMMQAEENHPKMTEADVKSICESLAKLSDERATVRDINDFARLMGYTIGWAMNKDPNIREIGSFCKNSVNKINFL